MSVTTERGARPRFLLPDRIRKAREYAGLSQQQLADELTVSRQSVVSWESGRRPLPIMVREIARVTGVDPDWLTELENENELPRLDSNQQPTGYRDDTDESSVPAGHTRIDNWITREFLRKLDTAVPVA
ncbi:MAG: helix-turn-helix transcriptional regulator [bacterium]